MIRALWPKVKRSAVADLCKPAAVYAVLTVV
jgi:hypothetical protein